MSQHVLLAGCGDQVHQTLSRLLTRGKFSVQCVTSINDALAELRRHPWMVVVDMAMEAGSGLNVIIAARASGIDCRLAVLSSGCDSPELHWIPKYHPDAIFGKPFDFADFVAWMNEVDLPPALPIIPSFNQDFYPIHQAA